MSLKFAAHCGAIRLVLLASLLVVAACSSEPPLSAEQARVDYDLLFDMPEQDVDFTQQVQPVLEQRCVVCHGCYDAPCQLKLSAVEGIQRGASKERVYNGGRIIAADPTRLFIDASTTEQWREKGFYPVIDESSEPDVKDPAQLLENSVMYRMLRLKQLHPQPRTGMLSDSIDTGLNRKQSCPRLDEFDDYAADFPLQGMPFALPNLSHDEYSTLVHWLAQGSPVARDLEPSEQVLPQIEQWETFLNGSGNKQQLVSRYIFEHLFQAHLHFKGSGDREFYRMVRLSTGPGEPVDIINTVRPYGNPDGKVFYRLLRLQGSIVAKNHVVYELSEQRMQRYLELFIEPEYEVASLPSYEPAVASNPIKAFASLPVDSRYRFLLDNARFFIEGFIKGPVCRGQIALNVIEDQFWVFFVDPDKPLASKDPEFLNAVGDYLATPAELEDNFKLIRGRRHYMRLHQNYVQARDKADSIDTLDFDEAMTYLWDGGGSNANAALTVFRHFDSASVTYGMVGDYPETAWVLDYPILERIHYLLVAGFDVHGNVGHQLNTRLYMDFLRIEGEDNFSAFLPAADREAIRNGWYSGKRSGMEKGDDVAAWISHEFVTGYHSDDPQRELYQGIEQYLGPVAGGGDFINRCDDDSCEHAPADDNILAADRALQRLAEAKGRFLQFMPDVAMLRLHMTGEPQDDRAYSLILNKAYKSVSSMFESEKPGDQRDYSHDTMTVVPRVEGSYPQFFYDVSLDQIETFVDRYLMLASRQDYERFIARYGVRRSHPRFWELADWFNRQYRREQPIESGILDLNRYQNR